MFKKFLLTAVTLLTATGIAVASVEVNKTDQAGLDGIRGIGPSLSKAILAERPLCQTTCRVTF
ncbi:DNA uptake protein ComE-like DNA-binding protein [Oxalobacteraceae bacterium GrIS 2.11]